MKKIIIYCCIHLKNTSFLKNIQNDQRIPHIQRREIKWEIVQIFRKIIEARRLRKLKAKIRHLIAI